MRPGDRSLALTAVNHVWAYDFVFDTCADNRSLKCLTVVDEFTRECRAIDVGGSLQPHLHEMRRFALTRPTGV